MTTQHPDLSVRLHGDQNQIAIVTLTRPAKRNALNDGLILALRDIFQGMPSGVRAAVIHGNGDHFCAGLDLGDAHRDRRGRLAGGRAARVGDDLAVGRGGLVLHLHFAGLRGPRAAAGLEDAVLQAAGCRDRRRDRPCAAGEHAASVHGMDELPDDVAAKVRAYSVGATVLGRCRPAR